MMIDQMLRALYGLGYNPFLPGIPVDDLWRQPGLELFLSRVGRLARDGGFALISGENGLGKSKVSQQVDAHFSQSDEIVVGRMERPQSKLGDFYRELGDLFGVNLSPINRYGGFKDLRARWRDHIKSTLFRPLLLIDEAQETETQCLTELRLLASASFDSECLLTTVLCGDQRLPERFRRHDLLPLGSRIRVRFSLEPLSRDDLLALLEHLLDAAGNPGLVSEPLKQILAEQAAGNPRLLTIMGAELLDAAAARNLPQLDEKLYIELFSKTARPKRPRPRTNA